MPTYLVAYGIYNASEAGDSYLHRSMNEFVGIADSTQVTSTVWYVVSSDNAATIRDKIIKKFKKVSKKMYEKRAEIAVCVQMIDSKQWATNIGPVGRWLEKYDKLKDNYRMSKY